MSVILVLLLTLLSALLTVDALLSSSSGASSSLLSSSSSHFNQQQPRPSTQLPMVSDALSEDGVEAEFGSGAFLPKVSSKINFPAESVNIKYDLWVVGAGTLGSIAAKQWKAQFPDSRVIAETQTEKRHGELKASGIECRLREARTGSDSDRSAKHVLICVPPSIQPSAQDYYTELADACRIWAGPAGGGRLVYTSSTAVYGDSNGNTVTETFRVDSRTSRSTRMICAEEQVVTRGGNIMRLAGLYDLHRGPHTFWLKAGSVDGNEDGQVNMLHYEDAAMACVKSLATFVSGSNIDASIYSNSNRESLTLTNQNIFLAADDAPITRIDVCRAAIASKQFDQPLPTFTSATGLPGKICDPSWTREQLSWRPKHRTFSAFMRRIGGEEVNDEPVAAPAAAKPSKSQAATSGLWLPGDEDEEL